jgi:hypothetical protein
MENPTLPIIVESETSNLKHGQDSSSTRSRNVSPILKRLPLIVIVVSVVLIIGEIIFGIRSLSTPTPIIGKIQPITGGQLLLVPVVPTTALGRPLTVKIRVDTGGHTIAGVDVILKFDPKFISADSQSFKPEAVFTDFPLINIDNNSGVVKISGISDINQPGYNGIGTLGSLTFIPKASGKTSIKIDYQPGSTIDSNIIESRTSQDIIDKVTDLNINIAK